MNKWKFLLTRLGEHLWFRATLYAFAGIAVALLATLFAPFVPRSLAKSFGGGTVDSLLNVLATTLLAVATFSVGAMLTAYTHVASGATPRAAALITGDQKAQSALATFVGAFLYSVVAFSADGTGYYGSGGRAIVFFVTLVVLALVAFNLLRWLDQLLGLARIGHAMEQVERATVRAMDGPFGRAAPLCEDIPVDAVPVHAPGIGYVLNVDLSALGKLARRHAVVIWVEAGPGAFAEPRRVVARVHGTGAAEAARMVAEAFSIGAERSFAQDVRFGMIVLGQIASKALSPGINDPGTAINVAVTAVRLLARWLELGAAPASASPTRRADVRVARPAFGDLVADVFGPLAYDGSGSVQVAMRLQRSLAALACVASPEDAAVLRQFSAESCERSDQALDYPPDRATVRALGLG